MNWENDEGKKVPHDDNRQRSGSQKEMINLKKEAYRVTEPLFSQQDLLRDHRVQLVSLESVLKLQTPSKSLGAWVKGFTPSRWHFGQVSEAG